MKFVKINAIWCGACIVTSKVWNEVKKVYSDIEIEELDLDFDEDEVKEYNVGDTLPVVICIKDNVEVERLIGEKSKEEIFDFVERNR